MTKMAMAGESTIAPTDAAHPTDTPIYTAVMKEE